MKEDVDDTEKSVVILRLFNDAVFISSEASNEAITCTSFDTILSLLDIETYVSTFVISSLLLLTLKSFPGPVDNDLCKSMPLDRTHHFNLIKNGVSVEFLFKENIRAQLISSHDL